MSDRLPRPVRLLLGATSRGVGDGPLHAAVAGRLVLITGASSGVGEATALRVGAAGATVLLVARRVSELERVRLAIAEAGGHAVVLPCDLADPVAVGALAERITAEFGAVDVVVSNAGLSIRRWVSESYERFHDFERTINVNYLGPVRLLLGLLPAMRERRSGHIVNVATMGVDFPPLQWSAYIASKTAFETWLAGVAPEIRPDGVRTTSIHLQLVRSPMLGPFAMWRRVPGMSTEEAAGIVARAIVERPRVIAPPFARIGAPITTFLQGPLERPLAAYAQRTLGGETALPAPARLALRSLAAGRAAPGALGTIAASRVIRPVRPDRLARVLLAQRRYGTTLALAAASAAELHGDRPAVLDADGGELSFRALHERSTALAGALHRHHGVGGGDRLALMCRNHRGFIEAAVAASQLGCDLVPVNTDAAGPQLAGILERERVSAAVLDSEFAARFDAAGFTGLRVEADPEPAAHAVTGPTIAGLIDLGERAAPAPERPGRIIAMTSGTTGTPRGAVRSVRPLALVPSAIAGLLDLSRIDPVPRAGEPVLVAPPLFHLFGMVGLALGFGLGAPVVLRPRFDAEAALAQIERHRAGVLLAVPTMLARIMAIPAETRERHDTGSLRMIVSGGAPLSGDLAGRVMDAFGDVLYNGYASTEVGAGTLATPADLRAAPGTVGRPMAGVRLAVLDDAGRRVPRGRPGRIFVGGPLQFQGYTGGGGKEVIDGLMSTGDVGHLDPSGRLFIDGRDDEMIVSGGENVFPQEVEDLLAAHPAVADAAVFGVADPEFGQRLAARVVPAPGARPTEAELRDHVAAHLARHKVPREIEFVATLPRTSSGKLQRRQLQAGRPAGRPARPRRAGNNESGGRAGGAREGSAD